MRVGLDLSPWHETPRRGVARALDHLLLGLHGVLERGEELILFHAGPTVGEGMARFPRFTHVPPTAAGRAPRATREALRRAVPAQRLDAFFSPWSAFPRLDVPVVVWVHELPFVRHGPIEGRRRTWAHRWWLREDARRAARILVPSQVVREDLLRLQPEAAPRLDVVPHGFDPRPWREGAARRGGARDEPPLALVVGARGARKGLAVLAGARAALAGAPLGWVLAGAEVGSARRRDVVAGERVQVLEHPSDAELADLYARASVLVHPSVSEGFGFSPLEAMAAGCPVVATRGGAVPEVVGEAALLVPAGDAAGLAAGILRVLSEPALREDLVARGRVRAEAFPVEGAARAWLAALERALASGAP